MQGHGAHSHSGASGMKLAKEIDSFPIVDWRNVVLAKTNPFVNSSIVWNENVCRTVKQRGWGGEASRRMPEASSISKKLI